MANLESRLLYGSYPEVVTAKDNTFREEYLRELVGAYLFKDILALEGIRHADKLVRLLQLLAFQLGKEVSLNELGIQLSMSKNTVERYLDLLEKVFVIIRLRGFSRNLRKEITKSILRIEIRSPTPILRKLAISGWALVNVGKAEIEVLY